MLQDTAAHLGGVECPRRRSRYKHPSVDRPMVLVATTSPCALAHASRESRHTVLVGELGLWRPGAAVTCACVAAVADEQGGGFADT